MGKNNKTKPIPLDVLSEQLINQLKEREFAEGKALVEAWRRSQSQNGRK